MKSRERTELEAEDVKTWLHEAPSLSEDHPLPSPYDCAQLLSLHPVILLLYPPPDCTQRIQNLKSVSLGYRSAPALLCVWTICALKDSVERKQSVSQFGCRRRTVRPPHHPQHHPLPPLPPHPQHPCTDLQRRASRTGRRTHIKPVESLPSADRRHSCFSAFCKGLCCFFFIKTLSRCLKN